MTENKCDLCGKVRTNEPDYDIIQPIMGHPLGWYYRENDADLCPDDIAKLMNKGNRTDIYVGWQE